MGSIELIALRRRSQIGYEVGRVYSGLKLALLVLPAVGLALLTSNTTSTSVTIGVALVISIVGLRWLGQAYSRAIVPGLVAGSAPLILPLVLRGTGHTCFAGNCWSICMVGCVVGGLAAGAAIGWRSAMEREQRWAFLSAAALLTGLIGSLGCTVVGAAGTVGMVLAVLASSLPISLMAQMRVS